MAYSNKDDNMNATPSDTEAPARAAQPGMVSFVGAGPGDPELLTIKGRKAIEEAALVLYAGSLVPPAVVACAAPEAEVLDSAPLTLAECHALVRATALAGGKVARVHTGDPSLYGALREQAALLEAEGIPWRVIPGITAACAAAAAGGVTFTVPEITQSLIITRLEGRTPVPERESLAALAAHGSSMAVYLSARDAGTLQKELLRRLPPETAVLCAHLVGWPEEELHWTRLDALARCVEAHNLTRQTVFLILPGEGRKGTTSRLYSADFSHACRAAQPAPEKKNFRALQL